MPELTKIRLINPSGGTASKRDKRKAKKAKAARKRPSQKLIMLGANPGERSSTMAKSKKKKAKRPGANYRRASNGLFSKARKRGKNPIFGMGKKRRRARRSNPLLPIPGGDFGKGLVGVVGGGLGARVIPENVPILSQYNNGLKGYFLNIAATIGLAKIAKYFLGAKAEEGALYGGALMTGSRIISDVWGKQIVQFGNVRIGNDPAFNFRRMGKYVYANPPLPVGTVYPNSGPMPPLPVATAMPGAPVAALPVSAKAAQNQPTTVAAATSMGAYGASRYGRNRFAM
jgi:hypothetical protein